MSLSAESSNFFITAATVIPVVFLALVLQGGFWEWIVKKITTGGDVTATTRIFVFVLQLISLVVVTLGTISEIIALDVLLIGKTSQVKNDIVFYSTAALIVMLGLVLLAKIPGMYWVWLDGLALTVEEDEEIRCQVSVYRWVKSMSPWRIGMLFMTNKRIVWMTKRELGLSAAQEIDIRIIDLRTVNYYPEPLWSKLIRKLVISTIPGGYLLSIATIGGGDYRFAIGKARLKVVREFLKECTQVTASCEPHIILEDAEPEK